MRFPKNVVVVFILTFICKSYGMLTTNQVPVFKDGHTITLLPSSLEFSAETSLRGVINYYAGVNVIVNTTKIQNASFVIFQIHSYVKPLALSLKPTLENAKHINGTDIGLYADLKSKVARFFIYNFNSVPVNIAMIPMIYSSGDPVPGGCNLVGVHISPFMTLSYNDHSNIIQVDAQAASTEESMCQPNGLLYEVYETYIRDSSVDGYFDAILSVVSAKGAELRGTWTRKPTSQPELRRRFAAYPGYGSVYVVTVRNNKTGKSAAYVPIAMYNCIAGNDAGCNTYSSYIWIVIIILSLVFVAAEIRYIVGRNMQVFLRCIYISGSIFIFGVSVLLYQSTVSQSFFAYLEIAIIAVFVLIFGWVFLRFLCSEQGQLENSWMYRVLSGFAGHVYALVPAHIFFGMAIFLGLGSVSGFQSYLLSIGTFVLFFLVFYALFCAFPKHTFDQLCGIFFLEALASLAFNGIVFYVYVDPTRIMTPAFSDVIFSPPNFWMDNLAFIAWGPVLAAYMYGRRALRQRIARNGYIEIESPPPYSESCPESHTVPSPLEPLEEPSTEPSAPKLQLE